MSLVTEKIGLEQALRKALDDPHLRAEICAAMGWDNSNVSRVKSEAQGILLEHVDKLIGLVGYVPVEPSYMEFLAYGAQIGTACRCAREGGGSCGKR